jgi:adenylate cyclase
MRLHNMIVAEPDMTHAVDIAVLEALGRVCDSKALRASERLGRILRYIVREQLEGRAAGIKSFTIAADVLGRAADFDEQAEAAVRADMARLRKALELYYATEGASEPIRFHLPRGTYEPTIERLASAAALPAAPVSAPARRLAPLLAILAGLVAILGAWFASREHPQPAPGPILIIEASAANPASEEAAAFALGLGGELLARLLAAPWLTVVAEQSPRPTAQARAYRLAVTVPPAIGVGSAQATVVRLSDGVVVWTAAYPIEALNEGVAEMSTRVAAAIADDLTRTTGVLTSAEMRRGEDDAMPVRQFDCIVAVRRYWRTYAPADRAIARACVEELTGSGAVFRAGQAAKALFDVEEARQLDGAARAAALSRARAALPFAGVGPLSFTARLAIAACDGDVSGVRTVGRLITERFSNDPATLADVGSKLGTAAGDWAAALEIEKRALALNPNPDPWYPLSTAVHALINRAPAAAVKALDSVGQRSFREGRLTLLAAAGELGDREAALRSIAALKIQGVADVAAAIAMTSRLCWRDEAIQALLRGLRKADALLSNG